MEAARTKELLSRLLPEGRLRLCDIGGGIGYYADWLAGLGHEVTLVELAPSAVEYARAHQTAPYRAETGDARDLSLLESGSMDAALLMGPLYHLLEREERLLALREAHRMLKPGGLLIAAGISKFSSATWAVARVISTSMTMTNISCKTDWVTSSTFTPCFSHWAATFARIPTMSFPITVITAFVVFSINAPSFPGARPRKYLICCEKKSGFHYKAPEDGCQRNPEAFP